MAKATKGKVVTVNLTIAEKVAKGIVRRELDKVLTAIKEQFQAVAQANLVVTLSEEGANDNGD